jgi:hypothetical protein
LPFLHFQKFLPTQLESFVVPRWERLVSQGTMTPISTENKIVRSTALCPVQLRISKLTLGLEWAVGWAVGFETFFGDSPDNLWGHR